jgi:hypothetical protein
VIISSPRDEGIGVTLRKIPRFKYQSRLFYSSSHIKVKSKTVPLPLCRRKEREDV